MVLFRIHQPDQLFMNMVKTRCCRNETEHGFGWTKHIIGYWLVLFHVWTSWSFHKFPVSILDGSSSLVETKKQQKNSCVEGLKFPAWLGMTAKHANHAANTWWKWTGRAVGEQNWQREWTANPARNIPAVKIMLRNAWKRLGDLYLENLCFAMI